MVLLYSIVFKASIVSFHGTSPAPMSQKLKLPSGKILKGKERKLFETNKIKLDILKSEKILGIN